MAAPSCKTLRAIPAELLELTVYRLSQGQAKDRPQPIQIPFKPPKHRQYATISFMLAHPKIEM